MTFTGVEHLKSFIKGDSPAVKNTSDSPTSCGLVVTSCDITSCGHWLCPYFPCFTHSDWIMVRLNRITHYTTQIHTVHLILGQIHRLYMSIHIFIIYPLSLFGMCIASLWSTGWFISFQNWELKSQRVWPWPIRSWNIFTAQNRGVETNNQIHSSNQIWQWQTIGYIYTYIYIYIYTVYRHDIFKDGAWFSCAQLELFV